MNARKLRDDLGFVLEDSGHTILGEIVFPDEGAVESRVGLIVRMRDGSHFQVLVIQTDGTAPVSAKDGVS